MNFTIVARILGAFAVALLSLLIIGASLCARVLSELATLLDARHGALYLRER
jgi:hypothetical protein